MTLRHKDLLGIETLNAEEIELFLTTAASFKEVGTRTIKKVPTLRGRTIINLSTNRARARASLSRSRQSVSRRTASMSASREAPSPRARHSSIPFATSRRWRQTSSSCAIMLQARLTSSRMKWKQRSSMPETGCTSIRRKLSSTPSRSSKPNKNCRSSRSSSSGICYTAVCFARTFSFSRRWARTSL